VKVEISVSEIVEVFKEIQGQPGKILEMVSGRYAKSGGRYLSDIMQVELTRFWGGSLMSEWKRKQTIATAPIRVILH